jgi:transcriptional regulator with XRE-family HTH domain
VVTFPDFSSYTVTQQLPIILPKGYKKNPEILGEHIRKIRIDRGLYQRKAAEIIGVTESTVTNWEKGTDPEQKQVPKIIEFLGYVPFEFPESDSPLEMLKYFRFIDGLPFNKLGEIIHRNPEQLADWFREKHLPCKRNLLSFKIFLQPYEKHALFITPPF